MLRRLAATPANLAFGVFDDGSGICTECSRNDGSIASTTCGATGVVAL